MTVFDISLVVGMVVGFIASLAVRPPWDTYRRHRREIDESAFSGRPADVARREARRGYVRMIGSLRFNMVVGVAAGAAVGALVGWVLSLLSQ